MKLQGHACRASLLASAVARVGQDRWIMAKMNGHAIDDDARLHANHLFYSILRAVGWWAGGCPCRTDIGKLDDHVEITSLEDLEMRFLVAVGKSAADKENIPSTLHRRCQQVIGVAAQVVVTVHREADCSLQANP